MQFIEVLYEDNHVLVVNKPSGVLVQADQTGDIPLIDHAKAYVKKKYQNPGAVFLGLVHRLDRPTSGILVLARTSKALSRLNKQFAERVPKKIYWALISGTPKKENQLTHYLVRNSKQNKSYAYLKQVNHSKKAMLSYKHLKALDRYHLLEIELQTGRHHQIRAQLHAENLFIKGDVKYGAPRPNHNGGIHLHARMLTFRHPTTKELITIRATPPKEPLWNACLI